MTVDEIMNELETLGTEQTRKIYRNHGIPEPMFGVKVGDLKPIQKRIKKDYQLALDLYDTGNYDAMYLAGLIADNEKMTKSNLRSWVKHANSGAHCDYAIPGVAAGSKHGHSLALEWIESKKEQIAASGWATLSSWMSITDDSQINLDELKILLDRIAKSIHEQPNRVRYSMNGFVIAAGCFVKGLTQHAIKTAKAIGKVEVDMGKTACKVPDAVVYIKKVQQRGSIGKKRKSAKC